MSVVETPLIVETDEKGEIHLPAEVLGDVKPGTRYVVKRVAGTIFLRSEERQDVWNSRTPEERAAAFLEWANRKRPPTPELPHEAFRRENMYD